MFRHVQLLATPWIVVHQASLSMRFSRQEYWCRLPFLPTGESSQPRDQTCISSISCIVRQIPLAPPGKPWLPLLSSNFRPSNAVKASPLLLTPWGNTLVHSLCTRYKRATKVHLKGKCYEWERTQKMPERSKKKKNHRDKRTPHTKIPSLAWALRPWFPGPFHNPSWWYNKGRTRTITLHRL